MCQAAITESAARFYDCFPFEYPTAGLGDYRESCLSIRTIGGYSGCNLSYVSHRILEGKPQLEGLPATFADEETAATLELTCVDNHIGMKVLLYYTAFCDTDVITRSVKIINEGTQAFYLTKVLSACLDMDNQDYEMISLHGSWARERHIQRKKVGYGIQKGQLIQRRIQSSGSSIPGTGKSKHDTGDGGSICDEFRIFW